MSGIESINLHNQTTIPDKTGSSLRSFQQTHLRLNQQCSLISKPGFLDKDYVKIARKKYRVTQRLEAGSYKYEINQTTIGEGLKFLTLTSSPRKPDPGLAPTKKRKTFSYEEWQQKKAQSRDISQSYRILKLRIQRKYPNSRLDYCRIKTLEGHGVLHIVGNFPFISYEWLLKQWKEIHASHQLNIQYVNDQKGLKWYLNPYIQNQTDRMSTSWTWIYRGWRKQYQRLKTAQYYKNMIKLIIPPLCNIANCRRVADTLKNALLIDSMLIEINLKLQIIQQ